MILIICFVTFFLKEAIDKALKMGCERLGVPLSWICNGVMKKFKNNLSEFLLLHLHHDSKDLCKIVGACSLIGNVYIDNLIYRMIVLQMKHRTVSKRLFAKNVAKVLKHCTAKTCFGFFFSVVHFSAQCQYGKLIKKETCKHSK